MAVKKIIIEGEDKDELLAAAQEVVEMLGGEASEETEEEETTEEEGDPLEEETEEETEEEEEDPNAALREKIKAKITAVVKKPGGADAVRAALKAVKAGKLQQVKDKDLKKLATALKVK